MIYPRNFLQMADSDNIVGLHLVIPSISVHMTELGSFLFFAQGK
jgi:hypothetical protein